MDRTENAMAAAAFFDRITARVQSSTSARRKLLREYMVPAEAPPRAKRIRAYDTETERLRAEMRKVVTA